MTAATFLAPSASHAPLFEIRALRRGGPNIALLSGFIAGGWHGVVCPGRRPGRRPWHRAGASGGVTSERAEPSLGRTSGHRRACKSTPASGIVAA
jgi:hypothetical protein